MLRFLLSSLMLFGITHLATGQIQTPSSINSASGTGGISGQIIDWNLGDIIIATNTGANIIITHGFLQNQPAFPTGVSNPQGFTSFEIKFLPNPAINVLQYRLSIQNRGRISMILYDINGKLLSNKQLQHPGGNQSGEFDLSALPSASYQLLIRFEPVSGNIKQGVYTIQKIK